MVISVSVPHDRLKLGTLKADEFECPCYCKADNAAAAAAGNPTRDPLKTDGDTPVGIYSARVGGIELPEHSYGPHQVIHLTAEDGPALVAHRSGLAVHGGQLSTEGRLRPTHGCIRVHDESQAELVERMLAWGGTGRLELSESD